MPAKAGIPFSYSGVTGIIANDYNHFLSHTTKESKSVAKNMDNGEQIN